MQSRWRSIVQSNQSHSCWPREIILALQREQRHPQHCRAGGTNSAIPFIALRHQVSLFQPQLLQTIVVDLHDIVESGQWFVMEFAPRPDIGLEECHGQTMRQPVPSSFAVLHQGQGQHQEEWEGTNLGHEASLA